MIAHPSRRHIFLGLLFFVLSWAQSSSTGKESFELHCNDDDASKGMDDPYCADGSEHRVPDDCELVFAKVPSEGKIDRWATYTMIPRKKGTPVLRDGDIVIQVPDLAQELSTMLDEEHNHEFLWGSTWSGQETGGQFEGHRVESVVTGIGMIARKATPSKKKEINVLPFVPRVDDGSLTRFDSPGAGAITQYHNYTWWFLKDIDAGTELIYSSADKDKRPLPPMETNASGSSGAIDSERVTLEYLKTNGYCIDNLRPRKSRVKDAGRGAFATRDLPPGSVVAPVPVALLRRDDLRARDNVETPSEQLLLNYCLGHKSYPWLLFPYSPLVNLINHYSDPNVEFRWSKASSGNGLGKPMVLELIATREIKKGEEIFLDYGRDWEDAWWRHVREVWKPTETHYTPSYVMDDAIKVIRTEQEQKDLPYPNNVFTSCFYRYSDRSEEEREMGKSNKNDDKVTSFQWHLTKGIYELKNLRPCKILKRTEEKSGRSVYAVQMQNWPGMDKEEIIPSHELHIVTNVPRAAIRFSDKLGTTDQYSKTAFRHEIGFPENLILEEWKEIITQTSFR